MPELTYTQMDKLLSALGFTVTVETWKNKLRVYAHPDSGAKLPLAYYPDDEMVLPHHMGAILGALRVYGIADPYTFAALPQKAS